MRVWGRILFNFSVGRGEIFSILSHGSLKETLTKMVVSNDSNELNTLSSGAMIEADVFGIRSGGSRWSQLLMCCSLEPHSHALSRDSGLAHHWRRRKCRNSSGFTHPCHLKPFIGPLAAEHFLHNAGWFETQSRVTHTTSLFLPCHVKRHRKL